MVEQADSSLWQGGPFHSFAALWEEHSKRVRALSGRYGTSVPDADTVSAIRAFIAAAMASGRYIEREVERQSAQSILDEWAAKLITLSGVEDIASWSPPTLEDYDPKQFAEPERQSDKDRRKERQAASREQIRLAAAARQWRISGDDGYLLSGGALDDALRFKGTDPDIDELIRASQDAAARRSWKRRRAIGGLIALLVTMMAVLSLLLWDAIDRREVAEKLRSEAESAREDEKQARLAADAEAQRLAAERAAADAERRNAITSSENAQTRLRELESARRQLDAALAVIGAGLDLGAIARSDVPEEILAAARAARVAPTPTVPPLIGNAALTGYDPDFLGRAVLLPGLSKAAGEEAFEKRRPLDYVNYSLVLSTRRRMALFSASNLDRQKLRVLPRVLDRFLPDPRVPVDLQPEASWFSNNDLDRGHLVTRREIAWGSYFDGYEEEAARRLGGMVNVYTNVTPQFDTFNQGAWSDLERWVLTEHNKSASRVSILSGPVLRDDDPLVGAVKVPRAFWKIAVSQRSERDGGLMVDAFLVPQFHDGTVEKFVPGDFRPELFRVGVRDIEKLTGLDFGDSLREAQGAESAPQPVSASLGGQVAARVALLDAPDAAQRKATAQQIANLLRDDSQPAPEKLEVILALADMARDASMRELTAPGRYNLLVVLSEIPKADWERPAWIDARAAVMRAVADLEARAARGASQIGPDTRKLLDLLKERLGWGLPSRYTVLLQFAGMTRPDAETVSNDMKALGWNIPGEERTERAAKVNEVRYGDPADEQAATLLAADLRARGLENVTRVVRNEKIAPGVLEIWISQ